VLSSNSDTPIGPDTFNTVIAPPQAGKTQQILFSVMEAAYDMGVLSVIGVMNSILETPRFRATADKINLIISRVAGAMGIPLENTPVLRIFDDGSTVTYGRALAAWGKGSNVIPVFVVMMNNVKFNRFQEDLLVAISGTVGRDDKGRRKIMLVVDEADLQYKTENNSSQLEKSIFSRKISLGGDHFDSLYGAFTTIINVTATPQAIATGDVDFGGRRPVVYEPEPSSTNFQYHKKPLWKNKIITRVTTDSKEEMYEDMVKDENNRIALVYESANCKVSGRSTAASSTAKDLSEYPGLVTFAWSSNKIEIFTADRYWIDLFDGAEQGVFTRKPLSCPGMRTSGGDRSYRNGEETVVLGGGARDPQEGYRYRPVHRGQAIFKRHWSKGSHRENAQDTCGSHGGYTYSVQDSS